MKETTVKLTVIRVKAISWPESTCQQAVIDPTFVDQLQLHTNRVSYWGENRLAGNTIIFKSKTDWLKNI